MADWKNKICQYSGYCLRDDDCVPGNRCHKLNDHFSQCIPNKESYLDSMQCLTNWSEPCDDSSVCCDPGSVCNRKEFRQCSQPTSPDCRSPIGFPSADRGGGGGGGRRRWGDKICQYSSYCSTSADCVPGNKCLFLSDNYSQCVPAPPPYRAASSPGCRPNWGEECRLDDDCCDPGALCSQGPVLKQVDPLMIIIIIINV